jgi:hypothetical protein
MLHPTAAALRFSGRATGVVLEVERLGCGPVLRVWFDDAIAFRQHPHDIKMLTWWGCGSLFRVRESEWAAWLERESQGTWRAVDFAHYGCRTIDGCYEVLSAVVPRAEWGKDIRGSATAFSRARTPFEWGGRKIPRISRMSLCMAPIFSHLRCSEQSTV